MRILQLVLTFICLICWIVPALTADITPPNITISKFPFIHNILQFNDSNTVMLRSSSSIYLSKNNGADWEQLPFKDDSGNDLDIVLLQEFQDFKTFAVVFTVTGRTFYTTDSGSNWNHFDVDITTSDTKNVVVSASAQINFANTNYWLFEYEIIDTENHHLFQKTFYSTDNLKSNLVEMPLPNTGNCNFLKSNPYFKNAKDETIICITHQKNYFGAVNSDQLISTDDFFKSHKELSISSMGGNAHILSTKVVNSFITVIVTTNSRMRHSVLLYTSIDGIHFEKAKLDGQEGNSRGYMFSILDSPQNNLYISVYNHKSKSPSLNVEASSSVYKSDSNGVYFKKLFDDVFSNLFGMSLISKVETLDGVWIASHNVVYNNMQLPDSKSMITLDDGKNWQYLNITDSPNCLNDDDCSLHIAWVTQRRGDGLLSTGSTPGILLGVGNVGKYLDHSVDNLKTFLSRDGGVTWKKINDKPTVFAFGDIGNILVTADVDLEYFLTGKLEHATDSFSYSLDQGESWNEFKLDDHFIPLFFVNNIDNTDKVFILNGIWKENPDQPEQNSILYTIDFSETYDRTCSDNDMEEWLARVNPVTNEQSCIFGHSEKFSRRKANADCFVNRNFRDIEVIETPCACTNEDAECNFGFNLDENKDCQPDLNVLQTYCIDDPNLKEMKLSKTIIPEGNICQGGFKPPVDDYVLKCKDMDLSDDSKVSIEFNSFGEHILYYQYLEQNATSSELQDETLIVLTASRKAYISFDSLSFNLLADENFIYIFTNSYFPDSFYLISDSGEIFTSTNRGKLIKEAKLPHVSKGYSSYSMNFDKSSRDTYILVSNVDCDSANNCKSYASVTEDNGETFNDLISDVVNCVFAESIFNAELSSDVNPLQIICSQKVPDQPYYRLISSSDSFNSEPIVHFEKIIGFAMTGDQYLVVATLNDNNDDQSLIAYVTVDGQNYAEMKFPAETNLNAQTAYTILDVNSNELFLHLTVNDSPNHEYGSLLKANYNGTLLTTLSDFVNRNREAFVDFEYSQNLEGLIITNVLINPIEKDDKKLVSHISHNDGATWSLLPPPSKDSNGNNINCKGCSLHLHSFTERLDPMRDSFSSGSAVGLMFGLGNVGTSLLPIEDENLSLFFTKDAGITWVEIAKGNYIWEFGDHGSILVIVETRKQTNKFKYSLDYGNSWVEKQFTADDTTYLVEDIATVPSDDSLKFILITKDNKNLNNIFTLDFTAIYPRQCNLPSEKEKILDSDFEFFTPKHPNLKDSCLFGHEKSYLRKKADSKCFVGKSPIQLGSVIVNNCKCTREDYECDYNYQLAIDGTCKLVKGLTPVNPIEVCSKENVDEWWEPTGYRKLALSTCEDGLLLDKIDRHPCPGSKSEHSKLTGWVMFWVIFIPFLIFAVTLVLVYERGIRRNGGFTRLGEIHLDDGDNLQLVEENQIDKFVNHIVRFGVFSFHMLAKGWFVTSNMFSTILDRNTGSEYQNTGSIGAFFNDMVDDDHSLFGDLNDDDAREIDDFLGNESDFNANRDDDFDDFATHDNVNTPSGYRDNTEDDEITDVDPSRFQLSDEEN